MKTRTENESGKKLDHTLAFIVRCGLVALALSAGTVHANNIAVTNVAWEVSGDGESTVAFDLSWDNSWRAEWMEAANANVTGGSLSITNWDAAWVFVKYRIPNSSTDWLHATLATDAAEHVKPAGATYELDVGRTDAGTKGVGVFIYRNAVGSGAVNFTNVTLKWLHGVDTAIIGPQVEIAVLANEMVYVPTGAFAVGNTNGGIINSSFHAQGDDDAAIVISSTNAFTIYWGAGDAANAVVPNTFPNGYKAFYCMKYEVSEGQWVDFFNMLTDSQKPQMDITRLAYAHKNSDAVVARNTVAWTAGDATTAARDRACSFLSWLDGCAYADWAGLRPMTELEYEKACRGPLHPVANEYAWGDTTISATSAIGTDGAGTDTATGGNCNYLACAPNGPYRVGIYATLAATRQSAGASYWGIMDLSGSLWERPVAVSDAAGRAYPGGHGDGVLTAIGWANAGFPGWLGGNVNTEVGTGHRGGDWFSTEGTARLRVADRSLGGVNAAGNAYQSYGWRAVRTAP